MFTKSIFALLTSLFFLISSLSAQELHPAYVAIKMKTDSLDSNPVDRTICGGVVIDDVKKLVATAWHCVPNQKSVIEKKGIFSVNGSVANLLTFSPESDIAIFKVVGDLKGIKSPSLKVPKVGELLIASAYYDAFPTIAPSNDRFVPSMSIKATLGWEGKVAAVANADRLEGERYDKIVATQFKWIVVSGTVAQGFSGGPVFDKAGNLVGIVSNINGGFTNVSSSENITNLLKTIK